MLFVLAGCFFDVPEIGYAIMMSAGKVTRTKPVVAKNGGLPLPSHPQVFSLTWCCGP